MGKKFYLFLAVMLCATSVIAQNQVFFNRVKKDKDAIEKSIGRSKDAFRNNHIVNPYYRDGENSIINTTLLSEDFSNFTAGSEAEPDPVRLDDPETSEIADTYFNTPGWVGLEVYQAGGCALIKFSEEYSVTGMIITPLFNTSGNVTIKCRMRSVNPEGDYVGYNIASEDLEPVDSNYGVLIDDQWTEITWFTAYGAENTYLYFFSYEHDLYIDDIEVIHHYMPAPTILDETNVTDTSFTANWIAIEEADEYQVSMYANHTATTDETYNLADFDFEDIESNGTVDNPEIPEEGYVYYNSWYFYLHVYADGVLGISGEGSMYYDYAYICSPELDLSSNEGKTTLTFKMKATAGESLEFYLNTAEYGDYQQIENFVITAENNDWNEYTIEFTEGHEKSLIEIWYYGMTYAYFDDFKVSQELKEGDVKRLKLVEDFTTENHYDFVIDEKYRNDELYYQLYGIKYVYAYDPYYDDYYMTGGIVSDFTEPRYAPTNKNDNTEGVEDSNISSAQAYFNDGQLHIFNPDNEIVNVYNINGVCVYNSELNSDMQTKLSKGLYIVKVGDKVMKVIND